LAVVACEVGYVNATKKQYDRRLVIVRISCVSKSRPLFLLYLRWM